MAKKTINYTLEIQKKTEQEVKELLSKYVISSIGVPNPSPEQMADHLTSSRIFGKSLETATTTPTATEENPNPQPETVMKIDAARTFDILRWPQNDKNPHAKDNPNFDNDYQAALSLIESQVKAGGVEVIASLPGRIATALQNDGLLTKWVEAGRNAQVEADKKQISDKKVEIESIVNGENGIKEINNKISSLQEQLKGGQLTIDQEEAARSEIARLTGEKTTLVEKLEEASKGLEETTSRLSKNESLVSKSEKNVKSVLKQVIKREKAAEKVGFFTRLKNWNTARKAAKREKDALKKAEKELEVKEASKSPKKTPAKESEPTEQTDTAEQTKGFFAKLFSKKESSEEVTESKESSEENANLDLNAGKNGPTTTEENANLGLNAEKSDLTTEENNGASLNPNPYKPPVISEEQQRQFEALEKSTEELIRNDGLTLNGENN